MLSWLPSPHLCPQGLQVLPVPQPVSLAPRISGRSSPPPLSCPLPWEWVLEKQGIPHPISKKIPGLRSGVPHSTLLCHPSPATPPF